MTLHEQMDYGKKMGRMQYDTIIWPAMDRIYKSSLTQPVNGFRYYYSELIETIRNKMSKKICREIPFDYKNQKIYKEDCEKCIDEVINDAIKEHIQELRMKSFKYEVKMDTAIRNEKLLNTEIDMRERLKKEPIELLSWNGFWIDSKKSEIRREAIIQQAWDDKSLIEKAIAVNTQVKKPATLKDGWVIYIVLMIVEMMFHGFIVGWIGTTIIFLIWRRTEINRFN